METGGPAEMVAYRLLLQRGDHLRKRFHTQNPQVAWRRWLLQRMT